jgi:phosphate:Na+ symporter
LITSSFTAEGLVGLVPALAIMLGANVGTTLIVQVLSFDIASVAPVLFVLGLVAFRSGPRSRVKDVGRVFIGLGLMLLSLHLLLDTFAPAENAPGVRIFMNAITGDPVLCILIGAAVTWIAHSSVASVLLIMSLAYAHFVSPYAALANDKRSRAGRSRVEDGQCRRWPRRGDQALYHQADARQPRRARGQAGDGNHLLRHQS